MANPFDRMIEAIAPVWGIRRAAARFALDQYRSYDAAKSSRRNDWAAPATSANAEIGPQVARIRAKARDLARNTELGANAVRRLSAHMVGTGIVPRLASEDAAERRAFAERFRAFSDHCDPEDMTDFGGKQLEVAQCVVESGTALMRFLPRPSGWRMRVPLQVQVLEPDYIDMSKNEIGNDGSIIIQGAEYDSWGRRVATWLFEEHPGDVWPLGAGRLKSRRFTMDEVRPVFHRLRPGQVWGVPWFFPVVTRMRDLADYEEAEHLRKLTEACFAVFIKRPPGSAQSPLIPGDGKKDAAGRSITKITPGMIKELGVGEEVTFSQPEPVAGAVDVLKHHMGVVAVGLGLPRHELTGDLSDANYSSLREGKLGFWLLLDVLQWGMLIPQACRPTIRQVERLAFVSGQTRQPDPVVEWSTPSRPWVDPLKDVVGEIKAMRAGLRDPREAIAARTGLDPDDVLASIAAFNKMADEFDLVLDSDPRRVTLSGVGQFNDPLAPGGDGGNQGGANA